MKFFFLFHMKICRYSAFLSVCIAALCFAGPVDAQRGDRRGHVMEEVWRDMKVPAAPLLSPEEELKTFKVAPGFRVELVAAEPMVQTPVEVRWDGDGRLWVVEMRAYMPNVDGTGEDARTGRVSVLEDKNGDGRMDQATVFLDDLQMPRAIGFAPGGGVLVAEPPFLWLCRDTDGDFVCDEKTKLLDNFARQGPVEHTDNGLLPALDNWIYNAKSGRRFRFDEDGKLQEDKTAFRGQWGLCQDDYGRLFYNSNSSYLHADWIPAHYLSRNKSYSAKWGIGARVVNTSEIFSIRVNPGINRGYQSNMLMNDGRLARVTAVCGPTVYRGHQFPEDFRGGAFVPEPAGNAVSYFKLGEKGGIEITSDHITWPDEKWGKREFLCSTDERFRPVNAYTGPDGCLYIVDMYRGILQHKVYVTTFLRKQIIERKLDDHVTQGRIWRIVREGGTMPDYASPGLKGASAEKLVSALESPNGWTRDAAQRILVQRRGDKAVPLLVALAKGSSNHLARIHALRTLDGLEAGDEETFAVGLKDEHPKVRITALRVAEPLLARPNASPKLVKAAAALVNDENPGVRLQTAFTLGEAKARPTARAAMAEVLGKHGGDRRLKDAVLSGLGGFEATFLGGLLEEALWRKESGHLVDVLRSLASVIFTRGDANQAGALLGMAVAQGEAASWRRLALLDGALQARMSKPVRFKTKPAALAVLEGSEDGEVKKRLGKLFKRLTWDGDVRDLAAAPGSRPLTTEEKSLVELGRAHYAASCLACHLAEGQGQPAVAPPLAGSEWVTGSEERLARIILGGMMGPVKVAGEEWNLVMPPHRHHPSLNDERIAGILSYVRRAWGNVAEPVTPATISRIRKETDKRALPWTAKELLELN